MDQWYCQFGLTYCDNVQREASVNNESVCNYSKTSLVPGETQGITLANIIKDVKLCGFYYQKPTPNLSMKGLH